MKNPWVLTKNIQDEQTSYDLLEKLQNDKHIKSKPGKKPQFCTFAHRNLNNIHEVVKDEPPT